MITLVILKKNSITMFYVWIEVKLLTIKLDIQRKRALVCFYVKTIRFIGKNANN